MKRKSETPLTHAATKVAVAVKPTKPFPYLPYPVLRSSPQRTHLKLHLRPEDNTLYCEIHPYMMGAHEAKLLPHTTFRLVVFLTVFSDTDQLCTQEIDVGVTPRLDTLTDFATPMLELLATEQTTEIMARGYHDLSQRVPLTRATHIYMTGLWVNCWSTCGYGTRLGNHVELPRMGRPFKIAPLMTWLQKQASTPSVSTLLYFCITACNVPGWDSATQLPPHFTREQQQDWIQKYALKLVRLTQDHKAGYWFVSYVDTTETLPVQLPSQAKATQQPQLHLIHTTGRHLGYMLPHQVELLPEHLSRQATLPISKCKRD